MGAAPSLTLDVAVGRAAVELTHSDTPFVRCELDSFGLRHVASAELESTRISAANLCLRDQLRCEDGFTVAVNWYVSILFAPAARTLPPPHPPSTRPVVEVSKRRGLDGDVVDVDAGQLDAHFNPSTVATLVAFFGEATTRKSGKEEEKHRDTCSNLFFVQHDSCNARSRWRSSKGQGLPSEAAGEAREDSRCRRAQPRGQ